jgi:hypothetical protein
MRGLMLATAALALAAPTAAAANDGFVEDVKVLREFRGEPNGYFGWAVAELQDVDRDGVTDWITSEPYAAGGGRTWVFSGRTGRTLHRFPGQAGDLHGYGIADAGDTDRDGVHDVLSGAVGRAYLYSGRTGRLLHTWTEPVATSRFGAAVSSAGDLNLDGHDDVAIGAPAAGAGSVHIYSGRTYKLLRKLDGRAAGDQFGAGLDTSPGIFTPELIVGAQGRYASVFAPFASFERLRLQPVQVPVGSTFAQFFVGGVGRIDRDLFPDVYVGDYGASWAGVYSGRDGSLIHAWPGAPGEGRGPGREAGDVDRDGRGDLAVGDYLAGPALAGRVSIFSGATGRLLRTFTSTTANENLGFDALGIGDTDRDGRPDLLLSAAEGDAVYLVSGAPASPRPGGPAAPRP